MKQPRLNNTITNNDLILCPECGSKMHKSGKIWSGRVKVQRYLCPACGRKATAKSAVSMALGSDRSDDNR